MSDITIPICSICGRSKAVCEAIGCVAYKDPQAEITRLTKELEEAKEENMVNKSFRAFAEGACAELRAKLEDIRRIVNG